MSAEWDRLREEATIRRMPEGEARDRRARNLEAEIRELRVCRHEECPHPTDGVSDECDNHESWMT